MGPILTCVETGRPASLHYIQLGVGCCWNSHRDKGTFVPLPQCKQQPLIFCGDHIYNFFKIIFVWCFTDMSTQSANWKNPIQNNFALIM